MTRVKVCGIRRVEDAMVAAETGAEFIGLVFAPSRRRIEPSAARAVVRTAKQHSRTQFVGVFVNAEPEEINEIAALCSLDYAQLSGTEPDEIVTALDVPAIQVFHVGPGGVDSELARKVEQSRAEIVLLDTAHEKGYGGTGVTFTWGGGAVIERPFFVAGGLDSRNVADAMAQLRPWGLDISSGVETEGEKDPEKIREFIAQVRVFDSSGR